MYIFLFDIDGTLIDSGGAGKASLHDALREQFQIDQPAEVPIHGCTDRSIASCLFESHGIEDTAENWQRFCDAYLSRLPQWLGRKRGQVLPGAAELLELLASRADVALGLLTGNLPEGARIKLEHFGLYDYFDFGGYGDHSANRHEVAEAAFASARQRFDGRVAAERTFVIGDTPNDVRCGRAIGARVVAVATGFYTTTELAAENPDLLLDNLAGFSPHWVGLPTAD